jgi:diacylglycerol kinase family enzyme
MLAEVEPAEKLLIMNPRAGSMTPGLEAQLREAFADFRFLELKEGEDLADAYASCPTSDEATVVVVGGDGTVEAIVPCLAGTRQALGIIPLGTFNNFARALELPDASADAIEVVKTGAPTPVTIGRANGHAFVEVAAVGLFGDAVALGESAKERRFGELAERLGRIARMKSFRYRLTGDVQRHAHAYSIVAANTPTVGARLEIATKKPTESGLELQVARDERLLGTLLRFLAALVSRRRPSTRVYRVRQVHIETTPPVPFYADAKEVGTTPVTIEAEVGGLHVILPARPATQE